MRILIWLDRHVLRHRWQWLCDVCWDWQLTQDDLSALLDAEDHQ